MIRRSFTALTALFLLFLSTALHARPAQDDPAAHARPDLSRPLQEWRETYGPGWRIAVDAETGCAEMLFGGRAAAAFPPRSDGDWVERARGALAETAALHGIEAETLSLDRAMLLPLGEIGSSDKMTVRFRQSVAGTRVVGGFVNVLLGLDGALLSIQSTGLPRLRGFATSPSLGADRALARAAELFRADFGLLPSRVRAPELVIDQVPTAAGERAPRLCWEIDAQRIEEAWLSAQTPRLASVGGPPDDSVAVGAYPCVTTVARECNGRRRRHASSCPRSSAIGRHGEFHVGVLHVFLPID